MIAKFDLIIYKTISVNLSLSLYLISKSAIYDLKYWEEVCNSHEFKLKINEQMPLTLSTIVSLVFSIEIGFGCRKMTKITYRYIDSILHLFFFVECWQKASSLFFHGMESNKWETQSLYKYTYDISYLRVVITTLCVFLSVFHWNLKWIERK